MARVTVMSIAVAEPKSDGTAEFALKIDVLGTMLFAVFHSSPD